MSSSSGVGSMSGNLVPKWQLALAVGTPVALGLAYMYYKNTSKPRGRARNSSKENGAPKEQISIDGDCPSGAVLSTSSKIETPLQKAQKYKEEGNKYFKTGKYDEAIAQYNVAIETCPKENPLDLATFYQNRAAAYEQLRKYSSVKADCTKALELNPKYAKAMVRRAKALEHSNELESALEDVTTACLLEGFGNQTTLVMADRVLKHLGKQHAQEHLANKKHIMPSKQFVKTYISSFFKDPVFNKLNDYSSDNETSTGLDKVLQALQKENYDDIIPICTEEIIKPEIDVSLKMELLLLRATFYLILGQHEEALKDFETVIYSDDSSKDVKVNALIKRAVLYMQLESPDKSLIDFQQAVSLDPDCSDIYHHRGQVNVLLDNIEEAKTDFERAVELNPNYGVAHIQKCYADYRYATSKRNIELIQTAMNNFSTAFKKFPDCPECYTLYAQILSEAQEYQQADENFARGIEKDPENATAYVHRGLLQLHWNGNVEKAVEYIRKAIQLDNKCEFAYEALGTLEVQRGNLKEAIELFEKAITLARTSMELTHIFGLRDAAKSQLTIRERLGLDGAWSMQNMS